MIDQMIRQLQDPDPQRRRQAIIALGQSKNPAAMQHLAQIFRNDPEPGLRELARRAGMHIRQAMASSGGGGAAAPAIPHHETRSTLDRVMEVVDDVGEPDFEALLGGSSTMSESTPPIKETPPTPAPPPSVPARSVPVRGREYAVTREDAQRSKGYIESALSLNMRRDNAKAMKLLAQALHINPNLVNDGYFMSVAGSVTGLEGDGAVQMILDSHQRKGFERLADEQKKQERIEKHLSEVKKVTWASTSFEIILFTMISAVGPLLAQLVLVESSRGYFNSLPPEILNTRQMQTALSMLGGFNLSTLVLSALISGVGGVIGLLLQTVFIHYIAILLKGHGTLRYLLELLLGFYNKWLPIVFFVSYIAIAVTFISAFSPITLCVVLPLVLLTLYVSGKTSSKIAAAYDFGAGKGCLAYFISILIISILSLALSLFAGQGLGFALQNLVPRL
jgi:hypothetical protein